MKRRIQRISPHTSATTMAVFYALMGVVMLPFLMLGEPAEGEEPLPRVFFLFFPPLFGVMGYVSIALSALLYNLVAGWVGGIELTFDEQRAGVAARRVRRAPTPPEEAE